LVLQQHKQTEKERGKNAPVHDQEPTKKCGGEEEIKTQNFWMKTKEKKTLVGTRCRVS